MKIGDRVLCMKGCATHSLHEGKQYTITDVRDWTSVNAQGVRVQGIDSWWDSERFQLGTTATKALRTLSDDLTSALDAVDADPSPKAWGRVGGVLGSMFGEAVKASGIYSPPPTSGSWENLGYVEHFPCPRDPIGSKEAAEAPRDPIGLEPLQPGDSLAREAIGLEGKDHKTPTREAIGLEINP